MVRWLAAFWYWSWLQASLPFEILRLSINSFVLTPRENLTFLSTLFVREEKEKHASLKMIKPGRVNSELEL